MSTNRRAPERKSCQWPVRLFRVHTEHYLGHFKWPTWSAGQTAPSLDICVVVHWPIESPSGRVGHFFAQQILNGQYFLPKFVRHSQPLVIYTTHASAQRKGAITLTRPLYFLILYCTISSSPTTKGVSFPYYFQQRRRYALRLWKFKASSLFLFA